MNMSFYQQYYELFMKYRENISEHIFLIKNITSYMFSSCKPFPGLPQTLSESFKDKCHIPYNRF